MNEPAMRAAERPAKDMRLVHIVAAIGRQAGLSAAAHCGFDLHVGRWERAASGAPGTIARGCADAGGVAEAGSTFSAAFRSDKFAPWRDEMQNGIG